MVGIVHCLVWWIVRQRIIRRLDISSVVVRLVIFRVVLCLMRRR